jgi:chromosome segregation protein
MLKSLDVFGFKSFADRTVFDFAPGITCIVGPNGSGKSNVVDSIKWILGDQSPKSLRGKEMTDVIFNGSSSRKPAGFAEATLTFDNSTGFLAVDSTEVQVGRRIYRSGEAEYLINRAPARLKDVRELFMGTGAGSSAYSIIEQGRVDALLQATNLNRRIVFEEAAGVSKFKARKVDAQRKLERVAQNLLRLTDIVDEVGTQLNSLRSQAAKATKFREASEELRTLRVGLAADDYRELTIELQSGGTGFAGLAERLAELEAEHQAVETEHRTVDARVADVEDRLRAVEQQATACREEIASHDATIRHQDARSTELEAEIARLRQQQDELSARLESAVGELLQTEGNLQEYVSDFEQRQTALTAARDQIQEQAQAVEQEREQLEQTRAALLTAMQQASVLGNRAGSYDSQFQALEATRERTRLRLVQVQKELTAAQRECDRRRELIEAALEKTTALRERADALRHERAELLGQQEEQQKTLAQLREQRSAWHARRALLEDLELRQEGLGIGTKEILARAQGNKSPPWNTVLGSVSDLLVVELEQAALLEVALGNRAQVIVVSEYGPLVEYLNQGRCQISGRVGFLAVHGAAPPTSRSPQFQFGLPDRGRLPDLSGHAGVVGRADFLVKSASDVPELAEQLLGDTWIVKSLDTALKLAAEGGRGCRFVTLQGEVLDIDGALYVGMVRSETALVSRKSELRTLKNDLLRLDRQIAAGETQVADWSQRVAQIDGDLNEAQTDFDWAAEQASELKSKARSQELEVERLARVQAEIEAELQQVEDDRAGLEAEAVDSREAYARTQTELRELQERIEAGEKEIVRREQELTELRHSHSLEQLNLAKQEERLQNLQATRSRLDQERYERDMQRDEAERRLQLIEAKREQIDGHLAETRAVVADLTAKRQELADQAASIEAERDQVRRQRSELAERELQLRHERRDLQSRQHARELREREIQQQLEHLAERIRDEYQVEVAEAAVSGLSALRTVWLAAHAGEVEPEEATGPVQQETGDFLNIDIPAEEEEVAAEVEAAAEPEMEEIPELADPERRQALRAEIDERIERLKRRIKQMGNVNTDSLKDLDELESRHNKLSAQLQDLVEAKAALEEIVRRINQESKRLFIETFDQIRTHFQELFRKLFGGGEGDVVLEDPEDVLECGIDVVARPPGKELRSISLLSGGEKTLTAVAMLLAIFKSRPSPFCILDEVDAALDEGNIERYMRVIQEFQQWTQFIVITHSKRTMSAGDVLYGVTMEESGVSKRMSVRFEDVNEDGNFRTKAA